MNSGCGAAREIEKPLSSAAGTRADPSWRAVANVEDLRNRARRRVPRTFFDYLEAGAYDELTLRANRTDLDALTRCF